MKKIQPLRSSMDMEQAALQLGFLPFFTCGIDGFSVEEMVAPEFWFPDGTVEGAWEWKGTVIREGHCAYGKVFNKKAGYVSLEWFKHLANYRRSKTLARDEDTAALDDIILQTIIDEGSATIKELRQILGFAKRRNEKTTDKISLDPILTRLMMECRLVISDFEYSLDRRGNTYGWGVARYRTPEALYGNLYIGETPQESYYKIYRHLKTLYPKAGEKALNRIIG